MKNDAIKIYFIRLYTMSKYQRNVQRPCDSKGKIIDVSWIKDTIFNINEDKFQICNCNFKDQPNHIYSAQHKFIEYAFRSHRRLMQLNIHKYIPFPEISKITF